MDTCCCDAAVQSDGTGTGTWIIWAGLAFLDDTDLIINNTSNDVGQVCKKMQSSLSMWHGLLHATRGELVPEMLLVLDRF